MKDLDQSAQRTTSHPARDIGSYSFDDFEEFVTVSLLGFDARRSGFANKEETKKAGGKIEEEVARKGRFLNNRNGGGWKFPKREGVGCAVEDEGLPPRIELDFLNDRILLPEPFDRTSGESSVTGGTTRTIDGGESIPSSEKETHLPPPFSSSATESDPTPPPLPPKSPSTIARSRLIPKDLLQPHPTPFPSMDPSTASSATTPHGEENDILTPLVVGPAPFVVRGSNIRVSAKPQRQTFDPLDYGSGVDGSGYTDGDGDDRVMGQDERSEGDGGEDQDEVGVRSRLLVGDGQQRQRQTWMTQDQQGKRNRTPLRYVYPPSLNLSMTSRNPSNLSLPLYPHPAESLRSQRRRPHITALDLFGHVDYEDRHLSIRGTDLILKTPSSTSSGSFIRRILGPETTRIPIIDILWICKAGNNVGTPNRQGASALGLGAARVTTAGFGLGSKILSGLGPVASDEGGKSRFGSGFLKRVHRDLEKGKARSDASTPFVGGGNGSVRGISPLGAGSDIYLVMKVRDRSQKIGFSCEHVDRFLHVLERKLPGITKGDGDAK